MRGPGPCTDARARPKGLLRGTGKAAFPRGPGLPEAGIQEHTDLRARPRGADATRERR